MNELIGNLLEQLSQQDVRRLVATLTVFNEIPNADRRAAVFHATIDEGSSQHAADFLRSLNWVPDPGIKFPKKICPCCKNPR